MITLEGRQAATASTVRALRTGAVAGPAEETLSALDTGLMATFSTRLHCRRPMQIVDPNEPSPREPLQVGGLSDFAARSKITILRNENGTSKRIPVNYNKIVSAAEGGDVRLRPGDVVLVP